MNGNNCLGPFMLIIPIAIVVLLFTVGWVAYALVRPSPKAPESPTAPAALSLAIADRVVRLQLARHAAACTLGFAGTGASLVFDAAGWSAVLAVISVFLLRVVSTRREALQRLARPGATAHRLDNWLVVTDTSAQTHVPVSARTFRAAERVVVPLARATQR